MRRKTLAMVGGVIVGALMFCAAGVLLAPLALVRSWTEVVGDVPSPDGKWDVVLMVRNAGAVTDYSTQLSVVPARRLSREIALCRPGNVFIADGNKGAVPVDARGMMHVDVVWRASDLVVITFPPSARVFRREQRFHSLTINYDNSNWKPASKPIVEAIRP